MIGRNTPSSELRTTAGRPRDSAIGAQILAAARALLAEGGYEALTFEAIVNRTGIGRPTIYRRWPTKAHLVAAIAYGPDEDLPETGGDLAHQLRALIDQMIAGYSRPGIGAATVGLISAYRNDATLRAELHEPAETKARQQLRAIVARAKARDVIDRGADADLLFDMIVGTITFRLVFSSVEGPDNFAAELAARLVRAFAPSPG